jgi:hypothetical protein
LCSIWYYKIFESSSIWNAPPDNWSIEGSIGRSGKNAQGKLPSVVLSPGDDIPDKTTIEWKGIKYSLEISQKAFSESNHETFDVDLESFVFSVKSNSATTYLKIIVLLNMNEY